MWLLDVDKGLIRIFECMQNSRMGFYVHEGVVEGFVHLRELITQKQIKVIVPSGYMGRPDEIWFVRILPEPFTELNYGYSVVFTTPYIISEMQNEWFVFSNENNWHSFFERNLGKTKIEDKNRAYDFLMKYGLDRHYWNEYIFEAYVNHQDDMILLAGFPDILLSRPHSKENRERFWINTSILHVFDKFSLKKFFARSILDYLSESSMVVAIVFPWLTDLPSDSLQSLKKSKVWRWSTAHGQ